MPSEKLTEEQEKSLYLLLAAFKRSCGIRQIRLAHKESINRSRQQKIPEPPKHQDHDALTSEEFFAKIIQGGIEEIIDDERTRQIRDNKKAVEETDLKLTELMRRGKQLKEEDLIIRKNRKVKVLPETYP